MRSLTLFGIGIFWCIYGILGLFGIQNIPEKYKRGTEFEKEYKRFRGINWLILGVSLLFLCLIIHDRETQPICWYFLEIAVAALPSIAFDWLAGGKYRRG